MRSAGYRRSVIKVKVPVKCKNVYLQLQIATSRQCRASEHLHCSGQLKLCGIY